MYYEQNTKVTFCHSHDLFKNKIMSLNCDMQIKSGLILPTYTTYK